MQIPNDITKMLNFTPGESSPAVNLGASLPTSSLPTMGANLGAHGGADSNLFSGILHQAIAGLGKIEGDATSAVQGLLSGNGTDIHTAMIASEKASLAFDTALALRNKTLGAYQQLMGMQF